MNFFFVSPIGYKKLVYAFLNLTLCYMVLGIFHNILCMESSSVNSKLIPLVVSLNMENTLDKLIKLMEIKSELIKEDTILLVLFDRYNPDIFNRLYLFISNLLIYLSNLPWIDYGIFLFFSFLTYNLYLVLISLCFFIILIKKDYQLFNEIKIKSKNFHLLNKIFLLIFTIFIAIPNKVWIYSSKGVNILILLGFSYFFPYLNFDLLFCSVGFMFWINYHFACNYDFSEKFRKITHSLLFCENEHLGSSYIKYFYGNASRAVIGASKAVERNPAKAAAVVAAAVKFFDSAEKEKANKATERANDLAEKKILMESQKKAGNNCSTSSPLEQELDWESTLLQFIDNIVEVFPNNIFLYSVLLIRLICIVWSFKWVFYFKTRGFRNPLGKKS